WISGAVGVDSEIPDVEIHPFLAQHFHNGILTGRQALRGSNFQPSSADRTGRSLHKLLLLTHLAGDSALDVTQNALAAFDLGADDGIAIERDDGLLGLLRLLRSFRCGASGTVGFVG